LASGGGTAAEHMSYHPKDKGLSPATAAGDKWEKMTIKKKKVPLIQN